MKNWILIATFFSHFLWAQNGVVQTDGQKFDGLNKGNLTDQDMIEAGKFHHDGKANQALEEGCANSRYNGEHSTLCDEKQNAFKEKNQWLETAIPAVSKLYGTMGLVGAGGTGIMKNGKEVNDYCRYIPLAIELAAAATQQAHNSRVQKTLIKDEKKRTNQREYILATANAHKQRKKSIKMQQWGYTITGACYLAYIISQKGAVSWKMYAKMAAAGGIATFYGIKAGHHQKRIKALNEIADSLPVIGECNPQTQTNCFCNEETSKTMYPDKYQRFCVPKAYQGLANGANATSCVDANNKIDHTCACQKTNSCFQHRLAQINPNLNGPGATLWKEAMKGINLINNGKFDEGKLDQWNKGNSAMRKSLADRASKKVKAPKLNLSNKERAIAKDLIKNGVEPKAAALISQSPSKTPPAFKDMAIASLNKEKNSIGSQNHAIGRRKIRVQGGTVSANAQEKRNPYSSFFNKKNKGQKSKGVSYMEFAEQAKADAEIVKSPETSIFKILGHRYKTTGWRELKVLEN